MLECKLIRRNNEAEALLIGRMDSDSAPQVENALLPLTQEYEKMILNLERLDYTSSAGLRTIKKLYSEMNKNGGQLVLTNVSKSVMEIFEITGFAGILNFR